MFVKIKIFARYTNVLSNPLEEIKSKFLKFIADRFGDRFLLGAFGLPATEKNGGAYFV
jgi:hypothetical protein